MSKQTYHCKQCGEPFQARVADRKRGWARFCDKQCAATYKAGGRGVEKSVLRAAQERNDVLGLSWAERTNTGIFTDEDGRKFARRALPNGGYVESHRDPLTGRIESTQEYDRHGVFVGHHLSSEDVAEGGKL